MSQPGLMGGVGPQLPSLGVKDNLDSTVKDINATIGDRITTIAQINATSSAIDIKNQNFETIYETYGTRSGPKETPANPGALQNWYKALPYGFLFTPRNGRSVTMWLPISPSNVSIVTHYSTNVIATMYGTIEQHSDQRYFDIVIEGTTGMVPKYFDIQEVQQASSATLKATGRQAFSVTESISPDVLGGFFAKSISTINQTLDKAANLFAPIPNKSGVDIQRTGYAAFHNLYKFFLYYKADTSGQTSQAQRSSARHPMIFLNYKDNNQYDCSIQKFTLKRSAENPMLYFYSIVVRAYNIQTLGTGIASAPLDRRLADLGLNGIKNSTVFGELKNLSSQAKQVVGAATGGLSILGS